MLLRTSRLDFFRSLFIPNLKGTGFSPYVRLFKNNRGFSPWGKAIYYAELLK